MGVFRHPRLRTDTKHRRRRGRHADPRNVRFVLRYRFGDPSYTRFAAFVAAKKWTIIPGGTKVRLPSYTTVLRFCRGDPVDERTSGVLCDELGIPFSLLQRGCSISESDLKDTRHKSSGSCCHPASYSGRVWIHVIPRFDNRSVPHHYTVRWGPWQYNGELEFGGLESAVLSHMKGDDGLSIPIFLDICPGCSIVFGRGHPPTELVYEINKGWTRAEEGVS